MKKIIVAVALVLISLSGCTPVQENYKPLYQATPEKTPIETKYP